VGVGRDPTLARGMLPNKPLKTIPPGDIVVSSTQGVARQRRAGRMKLDARLANQVVAALDGAPTAQH